MTVTWRYCTDLPYVESDERRLTCVAVLGSWLDLLITKPLSTKLDVNGKPRVAGLSLYRLRSVKDSRHHGFFPEILVPLQNIALLIGGRTAVYFKLITIYYR
jgi:hypothetical protein